MGLSNLTVELTDSRRPHLETRNLGDWQLAMTRGVVIGSDPSCDLVLEGPGVQPRHARYYARGHHRYLEQLEGTGEAGRVDYSPFDIGPWTLRFGEGRKKVTAELACEVIADELRLAIAQELEGNDRAPWAVLVSALESTPSTLTPDGILSVLQAWMRSLLVMLAPWPRYPAVVQKVLTSSETATEPWRSFSFSLRKVFAVTTVAGTELSSDTLIELVGRVLGAVYVAPGCALLATDETRWALATRARRNILWLEGSREEMIASVPDAHFGPAMAAVDAHSFTPN